jgi:hypothetical protein
MLEGITIPTASHSKAQHPVDVERSADIVELSSALLVVVNWVGQDDDSACIWERSEVMD